MIASRTSHKSRNIYVALTPYHVLLVLVAGLIRRNDLLVLLDESGLLGSYGDAIEADAFMFGCRAVYCAAPKSMRKDPFLIRFRRDARGAGLLDDLKFDNVFIFNDASLGVQFVLSRLESARCMYIEDGSAAYNSHYLPSSLLAGFIRRLTLGSAGCSLRHLGTHRRIAERFFLFPAAVHPRYREGAQPLSLTANWQKSVESLCSVINGPSEVDRAASIDKFSGDVEAIVLAPKDITDVFVSEVQRHLDAVFGRAVLVGCKFHPLSVAAPASGERWLRIERSLPAEVLPLYYPRISCLIGGASTALLSYRRFWPDIRVIPLESASSDEYFSQAFDSVSTELA